MTEHAGGRFGLHGPKCWVISICVGLGLGALSGTIWPGHYEPATPEAAAEVAVEASLPHDAPAAEHPTEADPAATHTATHDTPHAGVLNAPPEDAPAANLGGHVAKGHEASGPAPEIPLILVAPFALLLASIALMPFINARIWHHHYPDFAFALGGLITGYYLTGFGQAGYLPGESYGVYKLIHTGHEYFAFMALVGGLYVASGGVHIDVRGRGGPVVNTIMLAIGAVMANVMGTTGASVLLIRPFLRVNKGRIRPIHIVMFIFIVSNCGGALTPIGDPPLYLGFLKGVPFLWTAQHLIPMWATCIGLLLAIFFVVDSRVTEIDPYPHPGTQTGVKITGVPAMIALALIIGGVFIDPLLEKYAGIEGLPIGPAFQVVVAAVAYIVADREIHEANGFDLNPAKEVALLFIGIFATMTPALGYLGAHGKALGLDSPTAFYFGTGSLSAVLDNAPTYLNFLQVSFGDTEINAATVQAYLSTGTGVSSLAAISLGAVFFGAMTYIGNGPNFMIKSIADASGIKMPSFFGYVLRAAVLLLPVLVAVWAIFLR
ncbi:MAG: sodium:proton antiporter [Phycisphaeraceae bacterium]|nr:MAG: sodium:proton antiporter [Phycisphaeraceae bacterium]